MRGTSRLEKSKFAATLKNDTPSSATPGVGTAAALSIPASWEHAPIYVSILNFATSPISNGRAFFVQTPHPAIGTSVAKSTSEKMKRPSSMKCRLKWLRGTKRQRLGLILPTRTSPPVDPSTN
jgi:hypothetical protein